MTPIERLADLIAHNLARDPHFYDPEPRPLTRADRASAYLTPNELRSGYGSNTRMDLGSYGSNYRVRARGSNG